MTLRFLQLHHLPSRRSIWFTLRATANAERASAGSADISASVTQAQQKTAQSQSCRGVWAGSYKPEARMLCLLLLLRKAGILSSALTDTHHYERDSLRVLEKGSVEFSTLWAVFKSYRQTLTSTFPGVTCQLCHVQWFSNTDHAKTTVSISHQVNRHQN